MGLPERLTARWTTPEGGLDDVVVAIGPGAIVAEGVVIDADGRLRYRLELDGGWRARRVLVDRLQPGTEPLELVSDGAGRWRRADGSDVPALDGCIDVDIGATAFTHTLPVRRLRPERGAAHELACVFVDPVALHAVAVQQRYTALRQNEMGLVVRFEIPHSGYAEELTVDDDGLVVLYPDAFRRVR